MIKLLSKYLVDDILQMYKGMIIILSFLIVSILIICIKFDSIRSDSTRSDSIHPDSDSTRSACGFLGRHHILGAAES